MTLCKMCHRLILQHSRYPWCFYCTVTNRDPMVEEASTVQIPQVTGSVLKGIVKHFLLPWPKREQKSASEFTPGFFQIISRPFSWWQGRSDQTPPGEKSIAKTVLSTFVLIEPCICWTLLLYLCGNQHAAKACSSHEGKVFSEYSAENPNLT